MMSNIYATGPMGQAARQGTKTGYQITREHRLEVIDDAICDLYSGQDNKILFKHMDEEGRKAIREYLMNEVITPLRDWREKFEA